jgi:hypothetical protein
MRDPTDHTREVPIGATEMIRIVCKEILQSLVTTFTNTELEIRVKRFTRTIEAIANYVRREYSKEMKLLVKNQKPKEPVMPGKEEVKLPFMMKKHEKIRWAKRKNICDCEEIPGYEEQSGEPKGP